MSRSHIHEKVWELYRSQKKETFDVIKTVYLIFKEETTSKLIPISSEEYGKEAYHNLRLVSSDDNIINNIKNMKLYMNDTLIDTKYFGLGLEDGLFDILDNWIIPTTNEVRIDVARIDNSIPLLMAYDIVENPHDEFQRAYKRNFYKFGETNIKSVFPIHNIKVHYFKKLRISDASAGITVESTSHNNGIWSFDNWVLGDFEIIDDLGKMCVTGHTYNVMVYHQGICINKYN
mgnify:CR=1 FL=1